MAASIGSQWKKFVFASDLHGDKQDKKAARAFLNFVKDWKPEIKVFGGDAFDFRALRKRADAEEKRDSMVADYHAGMEFLEELGPQFYLLGNHELRLWQLSEMDNGIQSDYAIKCTQEIESRCKAMGTRILPYHNRKGVLKIGKLTAIHGFYCGITAARRTALAYGSCICGHGHAIDHATIEGNQFRMGRMVGCLAELDMEYSSTQVASLRHQHGFIAGVTNTKTGEYMVEQCYKVGSVWNFEVLGF